MKHWLMIMNSEHSCLSRQYKDGMPLTHSIKYVLSNNYTFTNYHKYKY